jgi:hypothetical protein
MRFFIALFLTNLRASFALRVAFWMQAGFMALNNVLFFTIWWILFERFEEIRGYRIEDMAALYGIAAAGYGVAAVLAGGLHDLARRIDHGDLDAILTQPKSVLVQAVASRTRPDGWGDIVSGAALLILSGMMAAHVRRLPAHALRRRAQGLPLHGAAGRAHQLSPGRDRAHRRSFIYRRLDRRRDGVRSAGLVGLPSRPAALLQRQPLRQPPLEQRVHRGRCRRGRRR